ncbi:EF-P 5-aminopentanol modification-associated protein YfmH [Phocicoccus pinnipedialis]|uniref:Zinc protease AlbF n=1 Tax=Phocicoccus pinnipedialis TaxID=110845 RepID=A0A6V7RFE7_9BACL|nr:pitrilysin family protein [Jeotgalicoccus pinnipedialis]MBP1939132.1 putative Zn-dependent peptidase [Jeotgalicoccus pinnipedialis]CAD2076662.1 Putative zinc protease AlbF [Jeotgalicoccus pinnipedialis]
MKVKHYKDIDETVYHEKMNNGLEVIYIKKSGFNKKFVTYTAKFGSIDNDFTVDGTRYKIPDGIAHFLEHKMFEKEDGDVFNKFSQKGANANAFTSYDRTTYLFSCTENFYENLKLLMDMVEKPFFTDESVKKEIGIINEEIKMYQDNPGFRVYNQLLESLYQKHPIRIDIAGTLESISEITKETLYLCHETFYAPNNMVMVIVGDFDTEELFDFIRTHQENRNIEDLKEITHHFEVEPKAVLERISETSMNVSDTRLMLGFKYLEHGEEDKYNEAKRDIIMMFALDMVFGAQSKFYYEMINESLIDESFNFGFSAEHTYGHTLFTSRGSNSKEVVDRILDIIEEVKTTDYFTEEMLLSQKRELLGDYLSSLDSPEYIANQYTKYLLDGNNLYEIPSIVEEITLEDVKATFVEVLDPKYMSESLVVPYE